jgi:DNA-binding CsgD family transcriptional regulator
MIDIDEFSQAVALIYDATLNVERWDAALANLSRLFDSPMAQLSYAQSWSDRGPLFRFVGFDSAALQRALPKYLSLTISDPRRPPTMYKPYHCRQLVTDSILYDSEIYKHALGPIGVEYSMYFAMDCGVDELCCVSIMRGPGSAPFTSEECEEFGRFVPHIGRAVAIGGTLSRARDAAAAARALIDGVPIGMIVLQDERIVLTNAAASALLEQGDALRRQGAWLQATTPQAQALLARALSDARSGATGPIGVTLPAGDGGLVRDVATPLTEGSREMLGAPPEAIAVYLTDSRQPIETREEVVRRLFGLTERETAVLCALAEGRDTREIARRLEIGVETVKTHLQHIMQSVGASRQAELVRMVLSSPAWVGDLRPEALRVPPRPPRAALA